jgi:hypothetical protein
MEIGDVKLHLYFLFSSKVHKYLFFGNMKITLKKYMYLQILTENNIDDSDLQMSVIW